MVRILPNLQVYILLFGVGRFETEGIYSMRAVMNNEGLPIDTIIAFESQEDAERWALHSQFSLKYFDFRLHMLWMFCHPLLQTPSLAFKFFPSPCYPAAHFVRDLSEDKGMTVF